MNVFLVVLVGVLAIAGVLMAHAWLLNIWHRYRTRDRRDAIDLDRPGRLANLLEIERRQKGDAGK